MGILIDRPEKVAEDHYLMRISMGSHSARPGQFVNIKAGESSVPLLRRPFSVHDAEGGEIHLVIRVVGAGTEMLSRMNPGEIDIIGPFGHGFTVDSAGKVLLIGGGVGNAPLYQLMKELKKSGANVVFIYSVASSRYIFGMDKYAGLADEFILATDDGSEGLKGRATDALVNVISDRGFDRIYCCGPNPMMERVVDIADPAVAVEISVENYFGCGVGICFGCTVDTVNGYKRACMDGPVFNGREILWDRIPG